MKTITLTSILMIILFSNIALATSVYTEYEGSGDLHLQTTIITPGYPTLTDTVDARTGCDGGCCCCPFCFGEYDGSLYVTNNPFENSDQYFGHEASVTNGCIDIEQAIYEKIGDQIIETYYYTYFNGTGTAESYILVLLGNALSYQFANGTGTSYASFSQSVFDDGEFDYATTYGGGVWVCSSGYTGLINYYEYSGGIIVYDTELELYCYEQGDNYAFLYAEGTDYFSLDSELFSSYLSIYNEIDVYGTSDYGFSVESTDTIYFDFNMELG